MSDSSAAKMQPVKDNAQPEKDQNPVDTNYSPQFGQVIAKYAKPSLDEIFRLAEKTPKISAAEIDSRDCKERHLRLADLVNAQKEFLRQTTND